MYKLIALMLATLLLSGYVSTGNQADAAAGYASSADEATISYRKAKVYWLIA